MAIGIESGCFLFRVAARDIIQRTECVNVITEVERIDCIGGGVTVVEVGASVVGGGLSISLFTSTESSEASKILGVLTRLPP